LIGRFKRLAAQQCQTADIVRFQQFKKCFLRLRSEGLAVFKIPGLGLKAVFAAVGAAGDKQRHPDTLAVGDITVFDGTVMHVAVPFCPRRAQDAFSL